MVELVNKAQKFSVSTINRVREQFVMILPSSCVWSAALFSLIHIDSPAEDEIPYEIYHQIKIMRQRHDPF